MPFSVILSLIIYWVNACLFINGLIVTELIIIYWVLTIRQGGLAEHQGTLSCPWRIHQVKRKDKCTWPLPLNEVIGAYVTPRRFSCVWICVCMCVSSQRICLTWLFHSFTNSKRFDPQIVEIKVTCYVGN